MSNSIDGEREQVAELLRKVVIDEEFRNLFRADPRSAILSSGVPLTAEAVDQIVRTADLAPSVMAHMEEAEEVAKCIFFFIAA